VVGRLLYVYPWQFSLSDLPIAPYLLWMAGFLGDYLWRLLVVGYES